MARPLKNVYIDNLRGLDVLRSTLSLSVIVWHYRHFFSPFCSAEQCDQYLRLQPFFRPLVLFYSRGYYAVNLFWLVSGIIFYKVYYQKLAARTIGLKDFFLKRMSRLYPLHFITLFIVLGLQLIFRSKNGFYFEYPDNSLPELIRNVFFIQNWGVRQLSFNGPTWSVSVEILAYLLFFVMASTGLLSSLAKLIFVIVICAFTKALHLIFINRDVADCLYFFFIGCAVIKIWDFCGDDRKKKIGLTALFILAFLLVLLIDKVSPAAYGYLSSGLDLDIALFSIASVLLCLITFESELFNKVDQRWFKTLGNVTYSTYLIHFPLQLAMILIIGTRSPDIFLSKYIFLTYVLTAFVLGYVIYELFEKPIQRFIRQRYTME